MIVQDSIRKVIDRSDIVEVIGSFIKVKRRGANYIANCPFHNEKTPSFNINQSKGIFKCFGCGKGGDVVSFVEEYEKFSFTESIRWLANFYKIELVETETSEEFKQTQQVEESLRIINDYAANYYHDNLFNNGDGINIGASYFKERGISDQAIEKFKLGYALDSWDAFTNKAIQQGFKPELLEKAGLIKIKENRTYDNYRDRVIFPIFSNTGRILGFGARILKKSDNAPKYINSPENELYVKNKVLYGLYQGRTAINKQDECLLVEGYMDVISLHQGGVENVVASSGTSLTDGQLKLIGNLTKNLTILYDGDAAGIKAALRGLDMALSHSFSVRLVLLPEGEDPDSFIQANGSAAFLTYIKENKKDVIEFRLELGAKESEADPMLRSKLVNELAETISKIDKTENFTLQQFYIHETATKLKIEEEGLIALVNKFTRERLQQESNAIRRQTHSNEKSSSSSEIPDFYDDPAALEAFSGEHAEAKTTSPMEPDAPEEWQLVKVLLEYGERPYNDAQLVAQFFFEIIDIDVLEANTPKLIIQEYLNYWQQNGSLPPLNFFINNADKNLREKVASLLQEKYQISNNWKDKYRIEIPYGDNYYLPEVESTIHYFELKQIRKYINENLEQIGKTQDMDEIMTLMQAHQMMKEREKELMKSIVIVK